MLEIRDLTHVYPDGTKALDDVSLTIGSGVFGLLGPNGAGKSTLMRTLATLQVPTSGAARLNDIDVLAQPVALRRQLGYLPQDFGVYPRISVEDMLDHLAVLKGISGRGARRELTAGLLHQVNLWQMRRRPLASLSGGMRQRFGIAQALIGDPKLVIVDEPTAGLDPEERNRCLDLLATIGADVVVILSTHIVSDVSDLCQNMTVLAGGRVLRSGAPKHLVASISGRVWRQTVERRDLPTIQVNHRVLTSRLTGGETVVHVLADVAPHAGFEEVQPTLEDAYFAALLDGKGLPHDV